MLDNLFLKLTGKVQDMCLPIRQGTMFNIILKLIFGIGEYSNLSLTV
jgi:hypothetical protein